MLGSIVVQNISQLEGWVSVIVKDVSAKLGVLQMDANSIALNIRKVRLLRLSDRIGTAWFICFGNLFREGAIFEYKPPLFLEFQLLLFYLFLFVVLPLMSILASRIISGPSNPVKTRQRMEYQMVGVSSQVIKSEIHMWTHLYQM